MIRGLIVALLLFFQQGEAPPDPNPEWDGQKLWCNDYGRNPHKCQCILATSCEAHKQKNPDTYGDGMGTRCSTHCKRDHCHCSGPCTT